MDNKMIDEVEVTAANAASSGPCKDCGAFLGGCECGLGWSAEADGLRPFARTPNAAYALLITPPVVIEMVSEIRRLQAELKKRDGDSRTNR